MEQWKISQPHLFMGCEQIGHIDLVKQWKCCRDFLRNGTDQATCPLDGDGDEDAASILLFTPSTRFRSTVTERIHFISLQKHKEMPCTEMNMSVLLLSCFITQTKHVNFNVSFLSIKLYSCYLCDIKLVSLHIAVKFSHLPFQVHFLLFPHNKLSRNYV